MWGRPLPQDVAQHTGLKGGVVEAALGPDLGVDGEELGQTEVVVVVVVQARLVNRRDERFSHVVPIHRQGTGDVELLVDHLLRTHRRHRYNILYV